MWRPFASDFVTHTYEGFRKKYDKVWTAKPIQKRDTNEKFDPKHQHPYKLALEEIDKCKKDFETLQTKVIEQRKQIKQRDAVFSDNLKIKVLVQKEEDDIEKNKRKKVVLKIRSMASNKIQRHKSCNSQEYYDNTFRMTHLEKNIGFSKNDIADSKNNTYGQNFRIKV
ncbi:hypothetical protein SteCoe_34661 [Stentor coeruleus]|uniref:Uncharacterized protein n=1 Tax=Stentor coeruleus TaxID=5963 RepID=A0A1R2AU60_9CILI|nr:hypothetical protein SteCoe_34661 [Stentor coeruleus]